MPASAFLCTMWSESERHILWHLEWALHTSGTLMLYLDSTSAHTLRRAPALPPYREGKHVNPHIGCTSQVFLPALLLILTSFSLIRGSVPDTRRFSFLFWRELIFQTEVAFVIISHSARLIPGSSSSLDLEEIVSNHGIPSWQHSPAVH